MQRCILLTGATGFVGSELLRRFIFFNSDCDLILPLRAKGGRIPQQRLTDLLGEFSLSPVEIERALKRVTVVDVESLSESHEVLARRVTEIVHLAADVRFDLSLEAARNANLIPTKRLLDLAFEIRRKGQFRHFHYLSTFAVAPSLDGVTAIEAPPVMSGPWRNTYEQSKAESEEILLREVNEIQISIYRSSIVVGDSVTGWTPKLDTIYLAGRLILEWTQSGLKSLPVQSKTVFDVINVDTVADALFRQISEGAVAASGRIYHLVAGKNAISASAGLRSIMDAGVNSLRKAGKPIPEFPEFVETHEELGPEVFDQIEKGTGGWEGFELLKRLLPYGLESRSYDDSNARSLVVGSGGLKAAGDTIPALMDYLIRTDLGKRPEVRPPLRSFVENPAPLLEPIAIVGLGGVFPGSANVDEFRSNLRERGDFFSALPDDRWDPSSVYGLTVAEQELFQRRKGGFVSDSALDLTQFRIPPLTAQRMDRLQKMVLVATAESLSGVNLARPSVRDRTGMVLGCANERLEMDYQNGLRVLHDFFLNKVDVLLKDYSAPSDSRKEVALEFGEMIRKRDKDESPFVNEDTLPGTLSNVAVGRVMSHFDLKGPSYGVHAGDVSGLVAIEEAVRILQTFEADVMVAGGVEALHDPCQWIFGVRTGRYSKETLPGEGAGLVVLKRLSDALRDGDRIYSVIRGIGTVGAGRSTAVGETRSNLITTAIRLGLERSEVSVSSIDCIESFGSGVPEEDRQEFFAIQEVFGDFQPERCSLIGKLGHAGGASGAFSLIAAVLGAKPRTGVLSFGRWNQAAFAVVEEWNPEKFPSQLEYRALERRAFEPIAVVGQGVVLPECGNLNDFWKILLSGKDTFSEGRDEFWGHSPLSFYDPTPGTPDKTYGKKGSFISEIPKLDPLLLGIPPCSLGKMDPSSFWYLKAAHDACSEARVELSLGSRTLVCVGESKSSGLAMLRLLALGALAKAVHFFDRPEVQELLGWSSQVARQFIEDLENEIRVKSGWNLDKEIDEDTLMGVEFSSTLARFAKSIDSTGGHRVVDAACASSLAAISSGIRSLQLGLADQVITGGVAGSITPAVNALFSGCRAFSSTTCKPFDEAADGLVLGEGSAVLVLRRLEDAVRRGDPVQAVMIGTGASSDGKGHSMMAPTSEGQVLAMRRALTAAGCGAQTIQYVECHGTGTLLGDEVEIRSMGEVYWGDHALAIGSVKSQIGHLIGAAGAVGVMKTVLGLKHQTLPPMILTQPSAALGIGNRVKPVTRAEPWPRPSAAENAPKRRAAVSSFGFGGTNWHLILEEAPPVVVKAQAGVGKSVVLFPGHGSPYPDMGRQFYENFPVFRATIREANEVLLPLLGSSYEEWVFSGGDSEKVREIEQNLLATERVQPLLLVADIAFYRVLKDLGFKPDRVLGHSVGEVAAAVAAGMISFDDAIRLMFERGRIFQMAKQQGRDTGKMVAVFGECERVLSYLKEWADLDIGVATVNSPSQIVISGVSADVLEAVRRFSLVGFRVKPLGVQVGWHSRNAGEIGGEKLRRVLAEVKFRSPRLSILGNSTDQYYVRPEEMVENWVSHLHATMNFQHCIERLYDEGVRLFVEAGPREILTGFVADILGDQPYRAFSTDSVRLREEVRREVSPSKLI